MSRPSSSEDLIWAVCWDPLSEPVNGVFKESALSRSEEESIPPMLA